MKKTLLALVIILAVTTAGFMALRPRTDNLTAVGSSTTTTTTVTSGTPDAIVAPVAPVVTTATTGATTAPSTAATRPTTSKTKTTASTAPPTAVTKTTASTAPPTAVTTATTSKPVVTTTTTSKPVVTTTTTLPKYKIINKVQPGWEGCHVWYRDDRARTYEQKLFDKYSNVACKNVAGPRKTDPNRDPAPTYVDTAIVWVDWVGPGEIDCPNVPSSSQYNGNTAAWWGAYQAACPGYDQADGYWPTV